MNIGLIFTLIISFFIIYLGAITLLHDRKNITNKLFFLISIVTVLWASCNYFSLQPIFFPTIFWSRLVLFFAVPHIFLFFLFIKNFPKPYLVIPKKEFFILSFLSLFVMSLTLTPYIFKGLIHNNDIPKPIPGVMMPLFGFFIILLLIFSMLEMVNKYLHADNIEKKSWVVMLTSFSFSYISIIITNFILVNINGDTRFILIAPLLMLPSILGIAYSIKKYRLFNVKAIATELIVFILVSVSLIQIILAQSSTQLIFSFSIFIIFLIVGILLIRSVYSEVEQRERLEVLRLRLEESNLNLEVANDKLKGLDALKTEFVSLASHQLRSPLTAIKGYTSMLLEGDYGEINPKAKETIERVMQSSNNLTLVVEDLLNVAKIEQGGMKYDMVKFNFAELVKSTIKDLSITAEKKGLKLTCKISRLKEYFVNGDEDKLRQVLINLIDNSMKYTQKGKIEVVLSDKGDKVVLQIKDTGAGISKETIDTIFEKFSRGDGARLNASGSGIGLYLVREIMKAHNGRVWVESDGIGKGSTFLVEIDEVKD
jgi:signal transduction histidine kinase